MAVAAKPSNRRTTSTRKPTKRTRRKLAGSSQPYGKHSGMTLAAPVPAADGSTKIFSKVTAANQVGDQAAEGDICRVLTNTSATVTITIGETQAQAAGATGYPIAPGKDFVLLGPAGVGWKGDVFAKGDGVAVISTMAF